MKKRTNYVINLLVRRWKYVVCVGVLASFVLVLYLGKGQNIWFDENYSIILAKQPAFDLIRLTGVDAHPPLYYLVLKAWGTFFGWSELAMRGLSALFSALAVGVIALLLRQLFTTRVALASLPFLVLAPFWLRYGYEIRMYALAGLIGALASLVLIKAVAANTSRRWWYLYAILVAIGMYTLYMTAVIWLSHLVWLLIYHRRHFWKQPWLWSYVGAGLLFMPYVPTLIFQLTNSALPGVGQLINLTRIGELVSMLLIYTPEWSVGKWSTIGMMLLVGLAVYLLDRTRHQMNPADRRSLGFLVCLATVPFTFFIAVSLLKTEAFFLPRYLVQATLFVYALLGAAVALGLRHGYYKAAGTLFVLSLVMLGWGTCQLVQAGNFNYERMQRPQTTKVRQIIDCKKSAIVADDAYTYMNAQYYFQGCDLRFYSSQPIPFWGGYASLSDNHARLISASDIEAKSLVHLHWKDEPNTFTPDSRYRMVSSMTFDRQVTDMYEIIAE